MVDARTASVSPERACISRTTSGIAGQRGVVGVDDEIDALAEDVEITVGDQCGDLDQRVAPRSSPVISQSIHTRRSFIWISLCCRRDRDGGDDTGGDARAATTRAVTTKA